MGKTLLLYVGVGGAGAAGAMTRLAVTQIVPAGGFPYATLAINVTGSFVLGWFLTYAQGRINISDTMKLAIATGFVGAYTTFSTFMWETDSMVQGKSFLKAALYLGGSIVLGLAAVRAGVLLAERFPAGG